MNTTSERLEASNFFICRWYFSFYEIRAQLSWAWQSFLTSNFQF